MEVTYTENDVRQLRRKARRLGIGITRRHDQYGNDGYMLYDLAGNYVVAGGSPVEYSYSYFDVLAYIGE